MLVKVTDAVCKSVTHVEIPRITKILESTEMDSVRHLTEMNYNRDEEKRWCSICWNKYLSNKKKWRKTRGNQKDGRIDVIERSVQEDQDHP